MRIFLSAILTAGLLTVSVHGGDWPQWNGPKRDGHANEKGLLKAWPANGPPLLWAYKAAGLGYSAPAVVSGTVYSMGCQDNDETMTCIDNKGLKVWEVKLGQVFDFAGNNWSRGPNSTPSVDGDLVFG